MHFTNAMLRCHPFAAFVAAMSTITMRVALTAVFGAGLNGLTRRSIIIFLEASGAQSWWNLPWRNSAVVSTSMVSNGLILPYVVEFLS